MEVIAKRFIELYTKSGSLFQLICSLQGVFSHSKDFGDFWSRFRSKSRNCSDMLTSCYVDIAMV